MDVKGFNHLTLHVHNLNTTLAFYTQVLGMTVRHKAKHDAYLEWGTAWICIIEKHSFEQNDKHKLGVDHIAFYIEQADFERAVSILKAHDVILVREPTQRGKGMSVNFLDPNGIEFELHTSTLDERMAVWK